MSNFHLRSLRSKKIHFYGCSELEAVVIPDQVTMIGKSAFDECTVLKSVTFWKIIKSDQRSGILLQQISETLQSHQEFKR